MLLVFGFLVYFLKRFRSFNDKNLGSVGQRAAKLPAIKLWEWFDPGCSRKWADRFECGQGWKADFFFRPRTLMAGNFAALWPEDSKFLAFNNLNLLKKHTKNQIGSSILEAVFVFSKWPHLHRIYVISGCIFFARAVECVHKKIEKICCALSRALGRKRKCSCYW